MRVLFIILLVAITFVLPNWVFGQTVDNKFNLKEFYPKSTKKILSNPTDPISDWPECSAPKDIIVQESKNGYFISWDGEEKISSGYYYEIEFYGENGPRNENIITNKTNMFSITSTNDREQNFRIRRVCISSDSKSKIYSPYTLGNVQTSLALPCAGGSITSTNTNACVGSYISIGSSTPGSGGTYQWQYKLGNCNSTNNWINITTNGTNSTLNFGPVTQNISFRRSISCGNYSNCLAYTVLQNPIVNISGVSTICNGASTTLNASSGQSYNWSNNATTQSINITPSTNTIYTVTVTTTNGCTASSSKTVNVLSAPTITFNGNTNICAGQSTIISAYGGENCSYVWSNGLGSGSSKTVAPTSSTTYVVTVTGANGCSSVSAITVNVNPTPSALISGSTSICLGQSMLLTATGGGTYLWNNNSTADNITISPTSNSIYTVTVTSNNGCTSSDTHTVAINSLSGTAVPSSCNPQNNSYSVAVSLNFQNSYTGIIEYNDNGSVGSWNVTNTSSAVLNISNLVANGSIHNLIISLPNCATTTLNYQAPNSCVSCTASINGITTICQGNSTTLTAISSSTYLWNNGATTQSITVSPSTNSSYSVTVTQSNNGVCSASANVVVNAPPIAAISGPPTNICTSNLPAILTASGGGSYHWSNNSNNQTITVSPSSPTTYTVTVTSPTQCTASASHLLVPISCSSCQYYIAGDSLICLGTSASIYVANTNCSNLTYLWSNGSTSSNINVNPAATTTYTVTVTNPSNQNSSILSKTMIVNQLPSLSISGNTSICVGDSTVLTASGAVNYYWSNNASNPYIIVSPASTTTYTVTGTNQQGCSSSQSMTVNVDCAPQCTLVSLPPVIGNCYDNSYSITCSGLVSNGNSNEVIIQLGSQSLNVQLNNQGEYSAVIPNLPADGLQKNLSVMMMGCDSIIHTYVAPQSCLSSGSFTYSMSNCDLMNNTFDLQINLLVNNPVAGDSVIFTEGGVSFGSIILSTATSYSYTFENIVANGESSIIVMDAPWGSDSLSYTKQSECTPSVCNIYDLELIASACNKVTQKFNLQGIFKIEHPVNYGIFYVSIVGSNYPVQTITSTGASQYNFTFNDLTANGVELTVSVQHTDICGSISGKINAPSGCNDLPEYVCGVSTGTPPSTSTTLLTNAFPGDVFIVAGMAFKCDSITGSNGLFSGVGSLSIPFGKNKLKVRFTNVTINNEYHVISGSVYGIKAQPGENYNIPQQAVNIGGDICVVESAPEGKDEDGFDKNSGLNDRGFGKDGKYQPGGKTYDPQGYDYQGNHEITGGPYDPYGCDVEGLTVDKKPCERDSTDIINKDSLITTVLDSIPNWLTGAAGNIQKQIDALNCDSLKNRVTTLIGVLQLTSESQYIVGSNGQYINKGMHASFASEPKVLLDNSGRDPNAIDLEKTHIELYKCDLFEDKLEKALAQLEGVDPDKFQAFIKKEIYKLSKEKAEELIADPDLLLEWVLEKLVEFAQNPNAYGYILPSDINTSTPNNFIKNKSRSSAYFSVAGMEGDYSFTPKPGEEEKWLFNQGFKEINGVDRGLYLEAIYDQMQQESVGGLSGSEESVMSPIALIKDVEGLPYKIFLDNIELSQTVAKLDAYFVFQDPSSQNGQKLVMKAENINFGPGGLIGETQLKLKTPIDLRLSNAVMLHLLPASASGSGGCYVSWDCKGFTGLQIQGSVEICRNIIVPLDPVTKDTLAPPARYSFDFNTNVKGWHDIYLEFNNVNSKPFAIAGYTDFKWTVTGVVIDNSDFQSPAGLSFIEGYTSPFMEGSGPSSTLGKNWKGVAMKTLAVTLPPLFNNNGNPVTTGVQNLIIDDTGANGRIFATPLIPYETGNLAGWQFSLDTLKIDIVKNHINGGGLAGKIRVPVLKNPTRYSAMIYRGGKFQFSISPSVNEKMDFLLADVILQKNSSISVTVSKNDATVFAVLHGSIVVNSDKVKVPKITFENFKVGNKDPYFNAGTWTIENNISATLFGFNLNVSKIKPFSPEPLKAGISFDISAELPKSIKAGGGLEIIGKMEKDNLGRQNWVYETTRVNKFLVDAKIAAGHLFGYLETFDEQSSNGYGEGFHGMIEMDFTSMVKAEAVALFANKNGEKFFFVDAAVALSTGIPVGPFSITGFAGGASYRMTETFGDNDPPEQTKNTLPAPGTSLSGTRYIFEPSRGLGLKAGITLGLTSSPEAFNGSLVFGIEFNSDEDGGGVAKISLNGKGQFMMKAKITGPKVEDAGSKPSGVQGKISAHVRFEYDFNAKEFSGNMAAYIDAPLIKGEGHVNVLANSSQWYIYIGTPNEPVYLDFTLPPFGTVQGSTYLDIGSVVPNMREIPANVRAVAYKVKPSSLRASGGGFVFGVSLKTKMVADAKIATAELSAEIGFDVMIRNFGNASCAASPGEKIGINGWYAMGQIYAFMEGKLKIFGVNIFSAALAGVLQAELPNPFFGQATLGVKIKTFFGSFHKSIALVLGTRCEIKGDPSVSPLGMQVIATLNPADKAEKMETDFIPSASLNLPMNLPLEMGQDIWVPYLKKFTLTSLKNQHQYQVDTIFSDDRRSFEAKPRTMFFAGDSIKFEVEVMVKKNGGNPIYENKTSIFTVGSGYNNIPLANIESSYPINGMHNYYRKENPHGNGFVQLKQGMPEIFYNIPTGATQKLRISPASNGDPFYIDYNYDGPNARIIYEMKPEWFTSGEEYKLELIRTGGAVETTTSTGGQTTTQQGSAINLGSALGNPGSGDGTENTAEAGTSLGESIIFSITFTVSTFDRFLDKINTGSVINENGKKIFKILNQKFDDVEQNILVDLKLNDPNKWMITEAYAKIFTVNINLKEFGCGIANIENGQEKFDDLNNELYLMNLGNNSVINNNVYKKSLGYYEELWIEVNGCDLGNDDLDLTTNKVSTQVELFLQKSFTEPNPPLNTIITYTIPGLGTTSTKTLSF